MRLFSYLYQRMLQWSKHPHAVWYLGTLSFLESSVFPIPPDVMLIPMSLAKPKQAWWYSTVTTVTSVLGGVFGYIIGALFFAIVHPWIIRFGYENTYLLAQQWFHQWGFWAILIAGFSPIPYKIFTIAAGTLNMAILPFIIGSFLGRGGRFYLIALIMHFFGERLEPVIMKYIERLGWIFLLLLIGGFAVCHYWPVKMG